MSMILRQQPPTQQQERPAICPACGLMADNAVVTHNDQAATATYCCTNGDLFSVSWLVVS